jgi:hypothetical protein
VFNQGYLVSFSYLVDRHLAAGVVNFRAARWVLLEVELSSCSREARDAC